MSFTNFPNGITSFGVPLLGGGIPATFGNVYFVDYANGDDTNYGGKSPTEAFKTLSAAISACTTNNNDIILVDGNSTVVETAMVTLSKNRVHIIGLNGMPGHFGQGVKISFSGTSGATNIATFKNTGVRNTISNVKFINSSTIDESLYAVAEGGEYTRYFNCEFYKDTDLDATGAAELLDNGDTAMFYNCVFGSTANATVGAVIRPNVLLSRETITGKVCRDGYFENCLFLSKAGNAAFTNVYGSGATDVERMLMFKDCTFLNNPLSSATPDDAVNFGAAQTQGAVFLKNCSSVDHTVMAAASVGIYVDGAVPTFATTGVSKAS